MSETNTNAAVQSMTELPAVARNIHLFCKKCDADRYHVVLAHTTPSSAKVKCEICGATKTFKLPKAQERKSNSPAAKRAATARAKKNAPDSGAVWADLRTQIGVDHLVPYNMKTKYGLANAINHPKFGIGFVTSATNDKIDVAFQEGGRALVHNRP